MRWGGGVISRGHLQMLCLAVLSCAGLPPAAVE
jgi:hypothetical protein